MTRVLITGAFGMLGYHLRCRLHPLEGVETLLAGRTEFAEDAQLDALVAEADAVVHLAGVNRGSDEEVEKGNLEAAESLLASLTRTGSTPDLLFSSSTHRERETPYGRSKREAAARLSRWAQSSGARFTEMVLPHVFGEQGRPFYNSVVHTFCRQLADGEALTVHDRSGQLELLHAGAVAESVLELLGLRKGRNQVGDFNELKLEGSLMTVGELSDLMSQQADEYFTKMEVPELSCPLELALFNCLRDAAYPKVYPVPLELRTDPRGSLFEAVRSHRQGQTFFSTTKPGITRGNHYHYQKVERFLVVGGEAEIRIRRLFDDAVQVFKVCGEQPAFVDMPTLHTHEITNTGDRELLTLFWAHEFFDPERPDTYAEPVQSVQVETAQR